MRERRRDGTPLEEPTWEAAGEDGRRLVTVAPKDARDVLRDLDISLVHEDYPVLVANA